MISETTLAFPQNIIDTSVTFIQALDPEIHVLKRPLRPSDPNVSVGIFASLWTPNEESVEMRGLKGVMLPTLQSYLITIHGLVKDMDEARGLAKHSVLAMMLRALLLRTPSFGVALAALSVTTDGVTEAARRWGILNQRFLSNELQGTWMNLATLEFLVETETS